MQTYSYTPPQATPIRNAQDCLEKGLNHSELHLLGYGRARMPFRTPPQGTLSGVVICWCLVLLITAWVNHVTSGKAGWRPDCSLHPCNGTSQVRGLWHHSGVPQG